MAVDVLDLKTFVPAKDYGEAKAFYQAIGFQENWANDNLAEYQYGDCRFLLQNFYEPKFAENLMIQLMVSSCDDWWSAIRDIVESHPNAKAKAPEVQAWGQNVLYLWDPSGVLWHIAEPMQ